MSAANHIALLRGINVGGHNKVPMAALRERCVALGWQHVRTYIASGNVVFHSEQGPGRCASMLNQAIGEWLDLDIPVIVRSAADWQAVSAANPFPRASAAGPKFVHAGFSARPFPADIIEALRPYAQAGERIAVAGGALWVHFPEGVARSKLTPTVLDRCAGSPLTARNWNTVCKLSDWLTV